ncbi:MAG: N-6 DNA methylase [Alkaliphilus sp.]|nr:N-6 DNA methylase [Alkaliphilus sp.]
MLTNAEQRKAAREFAKKWEGIGYEKGDSARFWLSLLNEVYGIERPTDFIRFEDKVKMDNTSFIDGYIPSTHVLIEQKGIDRDLRKPIRQSDGTLLTPFQQAKRYSAELPYSDRPRWIITCNFKEFYIYDMENPSGEPEIVLLSKLEKDYYRMFFLVDEGDVNIKKEMEISIQAGELVGLLYDALLKEYQHPEDEETLKNLNILCVRLVFCLYAEDAGLFGKHGMFHDYLEKYKDSNFRVALIRLFEILDKKPEKRDPYLEDELAAFPYVNGGLFEDKNVVIPRINDEIIDIILNKASANFDWSEISPTIFGAVFESTLNPETRRSGGMHYTSIENIHKVIEPLFMNDLRKEFEKIKALKVVKIRNRRLEQFQDKLSTFRFLDPACGSGNFLTETYLSLRRLENEILKQRLGIQIIIGSFDIEDYNPIKVSIDQFYGIEINDFAVTVARTALWIAESQMMQETEDIIEAHIEYLPIESSANIVEGNALRMDWNEIVPKDKLNYIMGNPPFVGARLMDKNQKDDIHFVFREDWKNSGNLDYVSCWFKKSADYIKNTDIGAALVATNSVAQGTMVGDLWKPLFDEGVVFNFAHRSFQWDSEATQKAQVHVVIIGFSMIEKKEKYIYSGQNIKKVDKINAYLVETQNVFVESRTTPLCNVPEIGIGNKPIDDGNYLFTEEEMKKFIEIEPQSKPWFKFWYGSREFINKEPRYCLWLGDCPPHILRQMPKCLERVKAVKAYRLASKSEGTRKLAEKPTRFHVENMPDSDYLLIPSVSSDSRKYVPIGFMSKEILSSNLVLIVPNATLYHFGILTSNVHMAWMRTTCGRLGNGYRYSKNIVYNNFPWPSLTDEYKKEIEHTAQAILDARNLYPESSLADLYNELTMPSELRTAHQRNDKVVMDAYGFNWRKMTESECVAELMKMYKKLTKT